MNHRLLFFLALGLTSFVLNADVYRWTDEHGNQIFSDTPAPGAEKIELNETTVVPAIRPQRPVERRSPKSTEGGYKSVAIASPANEQTLRNVQGIAVTVSVTPALRGGDKIQLYYDGAAYGTPQSGSQFMITDAERGAHNLAAAIIDASGKQVMRSSPSVFFLHRQAIPSTAKSAP